MGKANSYIMAHAVVVAAQMLMPATQTEPIFALPVVSGQRMTMRHLP